MFDQWKPRSHFKVAYLRRQSFAAKCSPWLRFQIPQRPKSGNPKLHSIFTSVSLESCATSHYSHIREVSEISGSTWPKSGGGKPCASWLKLPRYSFSRDGKSGPKFRVILASWRCVGFWVLGLQKAEKDFMLSGTEHVRSKNLFGFVGLWILIHKYPWCIIRYTLIYTH